MGRYDSPGWTSRLPGVPGDFERAGAAEGSQGLQAVNPYDVGEHNPVRMPMLDVIVTHDGISAQVIREHTIVGAGDTSSSSDRLAVHPLPGVSPAPAWLHTGAQGSMPGG